jgi:hypothetical protein
VLLPSQTLTIHKAAQQLVKKQQHRSYQVGPLDNWEAALSMHDRRSCAAISSLRRLMYNVLQPKDPFSRWSSMYSSRSASSGG